MKYIQIMCLILFSFLYLQISPVNAQEPFIDLTLFNTDARVFYVGDLDPVGIGNAPNYYIIRIGNPGPTINNAQISFQLWKDNNLIVDGITREFILPQGADLTFTNNHLMVGAVIIPPNEDPLEWQRFNVDFSSVDRIEKGASNTGKLVSGRYEFLVTIVEFGSTIVSDANMSDNILTISNPTTIEPIYPGVRVNPLDLPEILTTIPHFIWQSDADRFNLFIYRAYENESIQDVIDREWVLRLENYPNQIFQYPSDSEPLFFYDETAGGEMGGSVGAIRLLEPGNTYYWYVEALIPTASEQDAVLPSDVYQFKISDKVGTDIDSDLILAYLRQILGDRYDEVMRELLGYDPTGMIRLNGGEVQIDELAKLIGKLNRGEVNIQDLSVTQ